MKCDFCSAPDPTWKYPCEDFILEGTHHGSEGAWAACDDCAALIERNDRDGLALRSIESYPLRDYIPRGRLRRMMAKLHRHFFRKRAGSVERISKGQSE